MLVIPHFNSFTSNIIKKLLEANENLYEFHPSTILTQEDIEMIKQYGNRLGVLNLRNSSQDKKLETTIKEINSSLPHLKILLGKF